VDPETVTTPEHDDEGGWRIKGIPSKYLDTLINMQTLIIHRDSFDAPLYLGGLEAIGRAPSTELFTGSNSYFHLYGGRQKHL
jgi:hypothetical protein